MRRREFAAAVVLIFCSLAYGYLAWNLPERSLPNTPGPPFFPLVITVLLLALSVALLVLSFAGSRDGEVKPTANATVIAQGRRGLALWLLGAFVAYIVLLPIIGFIVATVPFFAALMVFYGERRALLVLAGALLMTVALYGIFRHGFGVFLPRGLLAGIVA